MWKTLFVTLCMLFTITYLINPSLGIFELIPDNLPFVGNIDEAGATALLIMCLRYFGVDIAKIFEPDKKEIEKSNS